MSSYSNVWMNRPVSERVFTISSRLQENRPGLGFFRSFLMPLKGRQSRFDIIGLKRWGVLPFYISFVQINGEICRGLS